MDTAPTFDSLRDELYAIMESPDVNHGQRAVLTPRLQSLGQWLLTVGSCLCSGNEHSALLPLVQIALTVVLQYVKDQDTMPPTVLEWVRTTIDPFLHFASMTSTQNDLASILNQLLHILATNKTPPP